MTVNECNKSIDWDWMIWWMTNCQPCEASVSEMNTINSNEWILGAWVHQLNDPTRSVFIQNPTKNILLMIQRAPFFYPKSNQEWISFKWSNTTLSFYPKSNSNFKMNILLIDNPLKSSFPILVMISNTWQWLKKQQIIFILKSKKSVTNRIVRTAKSDNFPD